MPPARRTNGAPQDSFSRLPAVRPEASSGGMPPARRTNGARGPKDPFPALPPSRPSEDSFDTMISEPSLVSEDSFATMISEPGLGASDSFSNLPAVSRTNGAATNGRSRRAADDSFDTVVKPVSDDRRAAHRAEDLTPEFGRPPARRRRDADPALSSVRLVPAMSSVDDSLEMPPVRMPKHGRPEDYGVPSARGGPEDSYDQIPAVERPRAAGGRRRARA